MATVRSAVSSAHKTHFLHLLIKLFDLLFKCARVCVCSCVTYTHLCFLSPCSCQRVEDHCSYMNKVRLFSLTPNEYVYSLQMSVSAAPGPGYHITKINQKPVLQFGRGKHKHGHRRIRTVDTDGICTRVSVFIHISGLTHADLHILIQQFCIFLFFCQGVDRWVRRQVQEHMWLQLEQPAMEISHTISAESVFFYVCACVFHIKK